MSEIAELRQQLRRIEAKWNDDSVSTPSELASLNRQRRELNKRIQVLSRKQ